MPNKKDVLLAQNLAQHRVGRVGRDIDPAKSFGFSFWIGIAILLQDRTCISPDVIFGFKRLCNKVIETGDLLGFIAACNSLRFELVSTGELSLVLTDHVCVRWTKGLLNALGHLYGNSIHHPSSEFDQLATFLGWLKRLPICIRPIKDSVKAYMDTDARIRACDFDHVEVDELREIWKEWFSNFTLSEPFVPKHGSGATADCGRIRDQKWSGLGYDQRVHCMLKYPDLSAVVDPTSVTLDRVAKVVFVPKQAGKDRTICMEPAALQYLQQGIAAQLIRFTHNTNHPLSKYVNIRSQEQNRLLCARAFANGYATIDLSDASDSVSWRLLKRLTRGMPLIRYLYASRSKYAILDGQKLDFDKFAPMGSALCFPIESFLFASIVELAYRKHYGRAGQGHLSGCSVYGDDIICPSEIHYLVTELLEKFGFIVNSEKSFSSGYYYESCGVEYCYGVRINTIRHPRSHILLEDVSPDRVDLISDLANALYTAGYLSARRLLLQLYCNTSVKVGKRMYPFSKLIRFGADHCQTIEPCRKERKWHDDYQCYFEPILVCRIIPKPGGSDLVEYLSRHPHRSRQVRIDDLHFHAFHQFSDVWSLKGVLHLSRFHYWELLRFGDIREPGVCRTGPLQPKVFTTHDFCVS